MKRQLFYALVFALACTTSAQAKPLPKKVVKAEAPAVDPEFAAKQANDNLSESEIPLDAKLVVNAPTAQAQAVPAIATAVAAAAPITTAAEQATPSAQSANQTPAETKAEVNKLPESQIPVLSEAKLAKKADGGGLMRIMMTLTVLAALLGGTLYALKRWAKNKVPKGTNTKIRILTQHALGPKKNLTIVQVAGETLLIGVTDHSISMLKTLALIDDEVPEETPKRFDTALEDYEETDEETNSSRGGRREPEEFAMRGLAEIRDTVSSRVRYFRGN